MQTLNTTALKADTEIAVKTNVAEYAILCAEFLNEYSRQISVPVNRIVHDYAELCFLLGAVYNYGKRQGIHAERKRKKASIKGG